MASQPRKLFLYAHTHWDREWYQPFETFRAQLLGLVRFLLPHLEDGTMPRFYLDGQSIILEDVLSLEPEHAETIKRQMAAGRLSTGPWYVLPDEMLVSGESLIRNLSIGMQLTRQYGEPALIGYCPDTFGHSQDLPNILYGSGIRNAIVWRGVPLLEMGPVFWWKSPDGSRVLAYHLTRGYYQTGFHELAPNAADSEAVENFAAALRDWVGLSSGTNGGASPFYKAIDGALLPVGADHVAPPANLQVLIDSVNAMAKRKKLNFQIVPTTLTDFMQDVEASVNAAGMKIVQAVDGELRFNRAAPFYERAYLLPGVLSTRLYLKRANRLSEYVLARFAEPIRVLADVALGSASSCSEFNHAWKLLLKNSPHDSICGCSVDAVHDEMMTRTAKLNDLMESVMERISVDTCGKKHGDPRSHLDPELKHDRLTVFNSSCSSVSAPVFLRWMQTPGSQTYFGGAAGPVQIHRQSKVEQLFSGWGSVPYYQEVDLYEGWVWAEDVPSLGFRSFPVKTGSTERTEPVVASGTKLSNGLLSVSVSTSGRLTVVQTAKDRPSQIFRLKHSIQDVGDGGDTYNFDPLPNDRPIEAKMTGMRPGKRGALVSSIIMNYEIDLPENAVPDGSILRRSDPETAKIEILKRSRHKIKHEITVELTMKRGVSILFFDATWENKSSDHRLEAVFDTGLPIDTTYSENHLSVVRRVHNTRGAKEKLPVPIAHEAHPDRFPAQRFVVTNGQILFNTGMPEYAVDGFNLSITMLRAVSYLSKPRLWTRGGGAGPNIAVPGANCLGGNKCSYGWAPLSVPYTEVAAMGGGDAWMPQAYQLADQYEGPLFATLGVGRLNNDAIGTDSKSFIHIDNPSIRTIACYRENADTLVLRLLNVCNEPQMAKMHMNIEAERIEKTNYAGKVSETFRVKKVQAGMAVDLFLGSYETQTLRMIQKKR